MAAESRLHGRPEVGAEPASHVPEPGPATTDVIPPRRPSCARLPAAVCLAFALLTAGPGGSEAGPVALHAQESRQGPAAEPFHASAHLPLGHWAYPVLDRWIAAGRITRLSPLVRPYRRAEVAREVLRLQGERLPYREERWLARLAEELAPELEPLLGRGAGSPEVRISAVAGGAWWSQTHRDPLRPVRDGPFSEDRLLEHVFVQARGSAGPVAGSFRGGRDGIFLHDAQFPDGRVVPDQNFPVLSEFGYRTEEAYLEVQGRYASLGFGRIYRDWGLPGLGGFVRSNYAYSEEEVAYRVGTDRIFLTGYFSALQDFGPDTARYLSAHRLEVRPWEDLTVALTEAVLWGGPDGRLDLALLNPLSFWHVARDREGPQRNALGQVDIWWRASPGLVLQGSLAVDGTNSPRESNACCAMGGTLGVEVVEAIPAWAFRLRGTALQSLVFRTSQPWEEWSVGRVGLGWDKADLYLATLEAEWLGPAGLLLRPRLDLQLLGEGDFRVPHPPAEDLPTLPRILVGTAETTLRASVAGRWRPSGSPLDVEWDVGLNRILDAGHVEGASRTLPVARVRVLLESPDLLLRAAP